MFERSSHLGKVEFESIKIMGPINEFKDGISFFNTNGFVGEDITYFDIESSGRLDREIVSVIEFIVENVIGESNNLEITLRMHNYQEEDDKIYGELFAVIGKRARTLGLFQDSGYMNIFIDSLPRLPKLNVIFTETITGLTKSQFLLFSKNLLATKVERIKVQLETLIDSDIFENGIVPMFSEESNLRMIELRFQTRIRNLMVFTRPELLTRLTELIIRTPRVVNFAINIFQRGTTMFPEFSYPDPRVMDLFRKRSVEFEEDERSRGVAARIMSTTQGQLHGSVAIEASKFT